MDGIRTMQRTNQVVVVAVKKASVATAVEATVEATVEAKVILLLLQQIHTPIWRNRSKLGPSLATSMHQEMKE